jgi:hypothetical protein
VYHNNVQQLSVTTGTRLWTQKPALIIFLGDSTAFIFFEGAGKRYFHVTSAFFILGVM